MPERFRPKYVESVVVVGLVIILTIIAVPVAREIRMKAISSEAISALAAIRTAERMYHSAHNRYTDDFRDLGMNLRLHGSESEFDGTYFSEECYYARSGIMVGLADYPLLLSCMPKLSDPAYAKQANEVNNWMGRIYIDQSGNIYSDIEELKYPRLK